jgi:ABC-type transporter Mla subunit MlaD
MGTLANEREVNVFFACITIITVIIIVVVTSSLTSRYRSTTSYSVCRERSKTSRIRVGSRDRFGRSVWFGWKDWLLLS